jgi:uncharacterized protein
MDLAVYRRVQWINHQVAALAAFLALAACTAAADRAAARPPDAAPQLISSGPQWKNVTELRHFAEKGDPQACLEMGDRLLNGDGLAPDPAAARTWLEKAAQAGVGDAMFRLGKLHHDGIGGPRDFPRALAYYTQAARAGVPEAQHNLGAMLVSGRGIKRDYVEGLAWLVVATKNGAASDAEQRTRERLAKRPTEVAAAEARAQELLKALRDPAQRDGVMPRIGAAGEQSVPQTPKLGAPQREAPPKVEIDLAPGLTPPTPRLEVPKS